MSTRACQLSIKSYESFLIHWLRIMVVVFGLKGLIVEAEGMKSMTISGMVSYIPHQESVRFFS